MHLLSPVFSIARSMNPQNLSELQITTNIKTIKEYSFETHKLMYVVTQTYISKHGKTLKSVRTQTYTFKGIINGLVEPFLAVISENEKSVVVAYADDLEYLVEDISLYLKSDNIIDNKKIIDLIIINAQKYNMKKLERYMKILRNDLNKITQTR